jgi:putative oxidoreductase
VPLDPGASDAIIPEGRVVRPGGSTHEGKASMRQILYREGTDAAGSAGLLILRLVVGSAFLFHGWPKIQAATHWMGPEAPVPGALQAAAAVSEFGGGIALILGVFTPLACLGLAGTMGFAITMVHMKMGHPFVASKPGESSSELAAAYLACVVLLLLIGPGRFSLDAALFGRRGKAGTAPEV